MRKATVVFMFLLAACAGGPEEERPVSDMQARIDRFAPAVIETDTSHLPASERLALARIIEAARYMDPIFLRQAWRGNPRLRRRLEALAADNPETALQLEYFEIMRCPWDRQEDFAPFAVNRPHPPGAGFYPEDMTLAELEQAAKERPALKQLYTVVRRDDRGRLVAVPYSEAYREWLEPAAQRLREAAEVTENDSLATFLRSRAEAFLTDDYYQSDKDWMDLDSLVEVTIGPYEVYEDRLAGLKASFEAFVTVADPAASAALARYKSELEAMEAALPVPDAYKAERGRESPIRVVDLVYSSGDARKSVMTLAFNLPNDERVRKEKGAKKVLLRNVIEEKFSRILIPIGERLLESSQAGDLSAKAFFNQVLFHELSHSMGPAYVGGGEEGREVRMALGAAYSPIEECKADVMGACNVLHQVRKGTFRPEFRRKLLTSYFVGLFRSIRFGLESAHGRGAAVQVNSYLEDGAASWDTAGRRFSVDTDRLEQAVVELLRELLRIQHEGDVEGARALLETRGRRTPVIEAALERVQDIPVDLRPVYPAAGERR